MRATIFAILLVAVATKASGGEEAVPSSVAVATFAKSSLIGMQLSVRKGLQQGKIPRAIADCVQSLDESSFSPVITSLLAENLTQGELKTTEAFFSSAVGKKYGKHGLIQFYASVGEPIPEALPSFSDAEYKELERFSRTSAGEKLMLKKVFESASARQAITSRIQTLMNDCRAKKTDS